MALRREVIRPNTDEPMIRPLYGAKLYLDDLEHIVSGLREFLADDSQQAELVIKAGESVADTVDDLRDASRRELKEVTISAAAISLPLFHLSVNFRRDGSKVRAWGSSQAFNTKHIVEDIADFVHQPDRRSWRFYILPTGWPAWPALIGVSLIWLIWLADIVAGTRDLQAAVISTGLTIATIPAFSHLAARRLGGRVKVVALRRNEARQRSRDTRRFYVLAFTGIVGAAIGVAGTLIVQVITGLSP